MGFLVLCCLVAIFDEIANGSDAYRTKEEIDADVEELSRGGK
jgi:hypothetical protein